MDSLAATPGTGPATSPLPVIRPARAPRKFSELPSDRTVVLGVLNVTPDSFSDGGRFARPDDAIAAGLKMLYSGADIIDVGGESTRPNAEPVDPADEQQRVLPVIEALARAGALVSIDTMHAATAKLALDAGAGMVNDVSGVDLDPEMPALIAARGVPYVLMHGRGDARTMNGLAEYDDVVEDVIAEIMTVRDRLYQEGVNPEQIIIDPGLGFAKTAEHNWELLRSLDRFDVLGHRILVGTSRKRFLGTLLSSAGKAAPPAERDAATVATTALAAAGGVWGVRVHDVAANLDAVKVTAAWKG